MKPARPPRMLVDAPSSLPFPSRNPPSNRRTIPAMQTETKTKVKGVADILFLLDATGSMQSNIDAVKDNIGAFLDSLAAPIGFNAAPPLKDWRAAVWAYRDAGCDGDLWLERNPFVRSAGELHGQLSRIVAQGGGDEPESLLDALHAVANLPAAPKGAQTEDANAWRYRSEAARVVVVFTDASYHPSLASDPALGLADVANAVTEARIRLSIFAPAMECYDDLSQIDKCEYTPVAVEPGETPVAALARFTGDAAHFRKTLEMLAKSVSASAAADALEV